MRDTTDRLFLIGIGGPQENAGPVINGSSTPSAVSLKVNTAHRFRFINISPLETHTVRLLMRDTVQVWRALAKDGADLPAAQATSRSAVVPIHPGETYDFEVTRPQPDSLTLRITSAETITNRLAARARGVPRGSLPVIITDIPVVIH